MHFFVIKPATTHVFVSRNVVDFGKLPQNSIISQEIQIRNEADHEVNISARKTGCNCVVLELDKSNLKANDSAALKITINTSVLSRTEKAGNIELLIETDDPGARVIPILVKYEPAGEAWISPSVLDFGSVQSENLPVRINFEIVLNSLLATPVAEQLTVFAEDPYMKVISLQHDPEKKILKYSIEIPEGAPSGELFSHIGAVETNSSPDSQDRNISYRANVIGNIIGSYYSIPKSAFFTSKNDVEQSLSISSRDKREFKISGYSLSEGLSQRVEVDLQGADAFNRDISINLKKIKDGVSDVDGYLTIKCESESGKSENLRVPIFIKR